MTSHVGKKEARSWAPGHRCSRCSHLENWKFLKSQTVTTWPRNSSLRCPPERNKNTSPRRNVEQMLRAALLTNGQEAEVTQRSFTDERVNKISIHTMWHFDSTIERKEPHTKTQMDLKHMKVSEETSHKSHTFTVPQTGRATAETCGQRGDGWGVDTAER